MHDSITMAEVGSIVKVSGNKMATPFGPPKPGRTPTKMPSVNPSSMSASVFQVKSTLKPYARSSNDSIVRHRPNSDSSGPFGMITSNATSKTRNMTAEKTNAVRSDFHAAMRPMKNIKPAMSRKLATYKPSH